MGILKLFINCITKKYATFKGRASRKEYVAFILGSILFGCIMGVFVVIDTINLNDHKPADFAQFLALTWSNIYIISFAVFLVIPHLAVTTRRLHDLNCSGWWQLLTLIPFVSVLLLLVLLFYKGTQESNKYGELIVN